MLKIFGLFGQMTFSAYAAGFVASSLLSPLVLFASVYSNLGHIVIASKFIKGIYIGKLPLYMDFK